MAVHTLLLLLGEADPSAIEAALRSLRAVTERYSERLHAYAVLHRAAESGSSLDHVLFDVNGGLHARLATHPPVLCLIRPDGHLGLRCAPPSAETLRDYLGRLLV